jgi:cell shape-determining protein MreC
MTSLLKSNRTKKREAWISSAFIFACIVAALSLSKPDLLVRPVQIVGAPFWAARSGIAYIVTTFEGYLSSKASLEQENNTLKQQLYDQSTALLRLDALTVENKNLKQISSSGLIYAPVLQNPGFSPYDTFLIGKGESDGIAQGDLVSLDGSIALGYISETSAHTAIARLYSSPGETMEVLIADQGISAAASTTPFHTIAAEATGRGGGNFQITLPTTASIATSAPVFLPGASHTMLGTIGSEDTDITHSFQTLYVALPINLNSVREVYIEPTQ